MESSMTRKTALLALADGRYYQGLSFGAEGDAVGEVVFNTSMTGYQEILTDPSYEGQLVAMTYPQIGNVGVNAEDVAIPNGFTLVMDAHGSTTRLCSVIWRDAFTVGVKFMPKLQLV